MNFQNLDTVGDYKFFLDVAFSSASKRADAVMGSRSKQDRTSKMKNAESARLKAINISISEQCDHIIKAFPAIDDLPEFYKALIKATLDYPMLKKSLGAVDWLMRTTNALFVKYNARLRKSHEIKDMYAIRSEFYGRISSLLRQIKKNLAYLEQARQIMRRYPSVKEKYFTVAICGFPNVGKTTLLSKITKSKPKISNYAFTTTTLNIGYMEQGKNKAQLIDTPGTLDRFDKMNSIEKQAYLAIKYCADLIVFVIDITEPFPLEDQKELLKKMKAMGKDLVIYLSKTDVLPKEVTDKFIFGKEIITDPEKLKAQIVSFMN